MRVPRYDSREVELEQVIPLSTPLAIYIDPSSACNFQCGFCPTADRPLMKELRHVGFMTLELFQKVINDLALFDSEIDKLILYTDGEPLLNPNFPDMVRYAKKSRRANKISTTTNASRLSPDLNLRIIEAGIDEIKISIYGMKDLQYQSFTKAKVDFEALVANIRHLYEHRGQCKILIKVNGDVISHEDEDLFYKIFEPIATGVSVEHVMNCWVQTSEFNLANKGLRANPNVGLYGQAIQEAQVCPYVFYTFTVHPEGTVSACFLDWQRKLLVGDVRTESLKEIWNGARMQKHRHMMLQGERKNHPVCGSCGQMTHGVVPHDNIDVHREELLHKFNNLVQIG